MRFRNVTFWFLIACTFLSVQVLNGERSHLTLVDVHLSDYKEQLANLQNLVCDEIDSDGDGVCDEVDLDDDNDGILDVDEICSADDFIVSTITPNGYDTQALQAGFHGALYKLVNGGYAITGFRGLPNGENAYTITEISEVNGYERASDILIGTYGGYEGGALFLLSNGDWASTTGFEPAKQPGWGITRAEDGPALPEGLEPSNVKVLNIHDNSTAGLFLLTLLDDKGNLFYNGRGRTNLLLTSGYRAFLSSSNYPNVWERFPDLPNGAKALSYDVATGGRDKIVVLASDGNLYALGRRIHRGDGSPPESSSNWLRLESPLSPDARVVQVSTSGEAVFVLDDTGKLYGVGDGEFVGSTTTGEDVAVWTQVIDRDGTPLDNVVYVSSTNQDNSFQATSIILQDGTVRSWGSNSENMLGVNENQRNEPLPTAPFTAPGVRLDEVTMIENGTHITPIIQNGRVFNVGHRMDGGFGDGNTTNDNRPYYEPIDLPGELDFVADNPPAPCIKDSDSDGIPDVLDLDADGDGCPDALEGDMNLNADQLDDDGRLIGSVDEHGVPLSVNGGQGIGKSTTKHVFSIGDVDDVEVCPGEETILEAPVTTLSGQGEFRYAWFVSRDDGSSFLPIENEFNSSYSFIPTSSDNGTIYRFTVESTNNSCAQQKEIRLIFNRLPNAGADGSISICKGTNDAVWLDELLSGADLGGSWSRISGSGGIFDSLNGMFTPDLETTESVFQYLVVSEHCEDDTANITVAITEPLPLRAGSVVKRPVHSFPNTTLTISVQAEGFGTDSFEYALDDPAGFYQADNEFHDVKPGMHHVYVRGKENCFELGILPVLVINYPTFMSPNNDGHNDEWYVMGLGDNAYVDNVTIRIYDRFGALLKEMKPNASWDGTVDNIEIPASDYWFRIEYWNKVLNQNDWENGHFSLVR